MANTKVTGDVIANGTISTVHLADDAITAAKLDSTATGITFADLTVDTDTLYVDAANNRVGIGTTSPLNRLAVSASNTGTQITTIPVGKFINTGNSFSKLIIGSDNANFDGVFSMDNDSTLANTKLRIYIGNGTNATSGHSNDQIVLQGDGNVGIGIASPAEKLSLYTTAFGGDTAGSGGTLGFGVGSTKYWQFRLASTSSGDLAIDKTYANVWATPVTIQRASGNVGINETNPNAKLDVSGNVKLGSAAHSSWTDAKQDLGGLDVFVGSGSNAFQVWDDNDQTKPRFKVERAGNVGIGTDSPDTQLHIYNPDTNWGAYSIITLGTDVEGTNEAELKYYRGATAATESFQLAVRGTTALTALYNGNVGIGTTSPDLGAISGTRVLTIASPETERWGILELAGNRTWGGNQVGELKFISTDSTNNGTLVSLTAINDPTSTGTGGSLKFNTRPNGGSLTERMRINSQGQMWLGGSYTGSDIANGNAAYLNNLNAGGFSVLHRNAADVYLHFNTYYNSSNNYTAKYGGAQGFRIDNGATGGLGFYKAPVVNTAGDTQTFSHVMQVGYGASNNVGIGTTSPAMGLHIADTKGVLFGASNGASTYISPSDENTINGGYGLDTDTADVWLNYRGYQDGFTRFRDTRIGNGKGSPIFMVDGSEGYVGIGTTSPNANLQVNRNTSTANLFNFLDVVANFGNENPNPGNHYASGIRIYQGNGTMGSGLAALNIGVDTNSAVAESQNTATIETPNGMTQGLRLSTRDSSAPIRFNTDSTERMRITSGGNLGIGETAPAAKLQVSGDRDGNSEYVAILGEDGGANGAANSANTTPVHKTLLTGYSIPYSGQTNARLTTVGFLEFDSTPGWTGNQRNWALTSGYDMGGTGGPKFAILMGDAQNVEPQLGTNGAVGTGDGANTRVAAYWKNSGDMVLPEGGLFVKGGITGDTNNANNNVVYLRTISIPYSGSTGSFTFDIDPVAEFGTRVSGGRMKLEVSGWGQRFSAGYIVYRNDGGGTSKIGTGDVVYYRYGSSDPSSSTVAIISVSLPSSSTNVIRISFSGWHTNDHGFEARLTATS